MEKKFPHAEVLVGPDFVGVTLDSDDYGSPTCDLAKLSAELATDVIWLCFQSTVDAFQFRHWRAGAKLRVLVFGCYGDEERTWNEVEGQPEAWESAAFFDPKALKLPLQFAQSNEEKSELQRIWQAAELRPERQIPGIDARESARAVAEYYRFPGWS